MPPLRLPSAPGHHALLVPRGEVFPVDRAEAAAFVDTLLGQANGRAQLEQWVGPLPDDPEELRARAIDLLASGDLVAVRLDHQRPLDDPTFVEPPKIEPTGPVIVRPTWISLEVLLEDGARIPGLALTITAPDGSIRDARLDADSRFRTDDLPRGDADCTIVLHANAGFAGSTTITTKADDILVDPGAPFTVELATERHHRLIVVEGKTEVVLLDTAERPVQGKRCRVVVDGRMHEGLTDRKGTWVVHHLRTAKVCEIEFPGLDRGVWDLQTQDGGAA